MQLFITVHGSSFKQLHRLTGVVSPSCFIFGFQFLICESRLVTRGCLQFREPENCCATLGDKTKKVQQKYMLENIHLELPCISDISLYIHVVYPCIILYSIIYLQQGYLRGAADKRADSRFFMGRQHSQLQNQSQVARKHIQQGKEPWGIAQQIEDPPKLATSLRN